MTSRLRLTNQPRTRNEVRPKPIETRRGDGEVGLERPPGVAEHGGRPDQHGGPPALPDDEDDQDQLGRESGPEPVARPVVAEQEPGHQRVGDRSSRRRPPRRPGPAARRPGPAFSSSAVATSDQGHGGQTRPDDAHRAQAAQTQPHHRRHDEPGQRDQGLARGRRPASRRRPGRAGRRPAADRSRRTPWSPRPGCPDPVSERWWPGRRSSRVVRSPTAAGPADPPAPWPGRSRGRRRRPRNADPGRLVVATVLPARR